MSATHREELLLMPCEGERLLGVLSHPREVHHRDVGVVIVVGGPQVRVGSHRQFTSLARRLAASGWPTLRFDVRGMGDSTGELQGFENISPDVSCAIDALIRRANGVRRVVLWGLCDGASASLLYLSDRFDPRVAGLCLLNPWVRSAASLARTRVKHYYAARLLQREFWAKLLRGRMAVSVLAELLRNFGASRAMPDGGSYQARMAAAWRTVKGPILLVLSGRDFTAREFVEYTSADPNWKGLCAGRLVAMLEPPDADHTFSDRKEQVALEDAVALWLDRNFGGDSGAPS